MQFIDEQAHLLERLLQRNHVLTHPFVIGEMALGNLRQRDSFLANLDQLPKTKIASDNLFRGVNLGLIADWSMIHRARRSGALRS